MRHFSHAILLAGLLTLTCLFSAPAAAQTKTGYWIALRSNLTVDRQLADHLGRDAGMIVVRAGSGRGLPERYSYGQIVARLRQGAPQAPVLVYSLVSRIEAAGRIDHELLKGLDIGPPLTTVRAGQNNAIVYTNIVAPATRQAIRDRLLQEEQRYGTDGLAVDGATRRPLYRPRALANLCRQEAGFCDRYAQAMDALMAGLNHGMGEGQTLLINGLRNFEPGMLEDQLYLLRHADAAAVEFFGLRPDQNKGSFGNDIRPYLDVLPSLPPDKHLLFFGRAPWHYTDYAADYRWQRYLYASFLLAARPNDLFKHHATFQVPTNKGRSSGLDSYADWQLPLGRATGPASRADGIYQRRFTNGRVVVAPDDGQGGTLHLDETLHTPEGQRVAGQLALPPGRALILLKAAPPAKPVREIFTARTMAGWGWAQATLEDTPAGVLQLAPLPEILTGEHDLLLDHTRSLTPYRHLALQLQAGNDSAEAWAIAEVDDPRRQVFWLAVHLGNTALTGTVVSKDFRAPPRKNDPAHWPVVSAGPLPTRMATVRLDGPQLAATAGLSFRRWSHVRLKGPLSLAEVVLEAPQSAVRIHTVSADTNITSTPCRQTHLPPMNAISSGKNLQLHGRCAKH